MPEPPFTPPFSSDRRSQTSAASTVPPPSFMPLVGESAESRGRRARRAAPAAAESVCPDREYDAPRRGLHLPARARSSRGSRGCSTVSGWLSASTFSEVLLFITSSTLFFQQRANHHGWRRPAVPAPGAGSSAGWWCRRFSAQQQDWCSLPRAGLRAGTRWFCCRLLPVGCVAAGCAAGVAATGAGSGAAAGFAAGAACSFRWRLHRIGLAAGGGEIADFRLRRAHHIIIAGNIRRLGDLRRHRAAAGPAWGAILRRFKTLLDSAAENRRLAVQTAAAGRFYWSRPVYSFAYSPAAVGSICAPGFCG